MAEGIVPAVWDSPFPAWMSICSTLEKVQQINVTKTSRRKSEKSSRVHHKWAKTGVVTWSTCVMPPTVTIQAAGLHVPQHCPGIFVYLWPCFERNREEMTLRWDTDLNWSISELSGVGITDRKIALTAGQYVSQITGLHLIVAWWGLE